MNWINGKDVEKLKSILSEYENINRFERINSDTELYFRNISSTDEDFTEIRFDTILDLKSKIGSHSQNCDEKIVHELAKLYYKLLFYDSNSSQNSEQKNDDLSIPDYIYTF